ncbi:Rpr2-domain-containing protein [Pseudohyphozyma bogoriensis]|nr:Rpr2-domain-containing protein [Pseudohyphozyma bogoriensis]
MAKKTKTLITEPSPAAVNSKDVLQRLNYMYQASVFLSTALDPAPSSSSSKPKGKGREAPAPPKEFLIPTQVDAGGASGSGDGGEEDEELMGVDPSPSESAAAATTRGTEFLDELEGIVRDSTKGKGKEKAVEVPKKRKQPASARPPLSRMLVAGMKEVAKKGTVKMDPSVKRTMCKGCSAVLIPGLSCTVRIKPSGPHAHIVVKTCLACRRQLRLPAPPHLPPEPPSSINPNPPAATANDDTMEVENLESGEKKERRLTKRERREKRQQRKPTFFEREGHVTFVGMEKVRTT